LTVTENGYGKRTEVSAYRLASRGTQGVIAIGTTERNGKLVTAKIVADDDEIMLITDGGVLIRVGVDTIRETGRSAQGVKLINLGKNEKVVDIACVVESEGAFSDENEAQESGEVLPITDLFAKE
jgi:DNA gyrase subunit A